MKENELRECAECNICGNKIGDLGIPLFYRVRIQRYGLKRDAIMRQDGLAQYLGGHSLLAQVMGPNEDMAEMIFEKEITVCEKCSTEETCLAIMAEKGKE